MSAASQLLSFPPKMSPNAAIATGFLKKHFPGWQNLVAIAPNGGIEGRTFAPDDDVAMGRWIDERNGKKNLYFSIGEPVPDAGDRRLSRAQIARARAVWIDIDVKNENERAELLELALGDDELPDGVLPSCTIDSGTGYWAFYLLKDNPAFEDVEAQNRALVAARRGDPASVDMARIARLPGTVNLKNGKTATVRQETDEGRFALAEIAEWCPPQPVRHRAGMQAPLGIELDAPDAIERARAYLRAAGPAFEGEGGDNRTIVVINRVFDFGTSEAGAIDVLMHDDENADGSWNDRCVPPWSESDLFKKVRSAAKSRQEPIGRNSPERAATEFSAVDIAGTAPATKTERPFPVQRMDRFTAADIPPRKFIAGKFLARRFASLLISPPGVGKTTWLAQLAVAVASGRGDIIGMDVHERTSVLLWNAEDDLDELKRHILATMVAFEISHEDLTIEGELGIHFGSGVVDRVIFADKLNDTVRETRSVGLFEDYIRRHNIGVAVFDPLVNLHRVKENANEELEAAARVFDSIAKRTECSTVIAHHTKKPQQGDSGGYAGNPDSARGALALIGVVRMAATLYTIDEKTAKQYGVEDDAAWYRRFDNAKSNLGPPGKGTLFFKFEGTLLDGIGSEEVGVMRPVALIAQENAKKRRRSALVDDAIACLGGVPVMPYASLVGALQANPFYSKDTAPALRGRLNSAFADGVEGEDARYVLETRSVEGMKGRHKCLVRVASNRKQETEI